MVRFSKLSLAHTLQVGVMDHHQWVWRTYLELDRLQDHRGRARVRVRVRVRITVRVTIRIRDRVTLQI